MQLAKDECWARVERSDHGVLGTVHAERGVDTVPVVFAVHGRRVLIPIDTVKAKHGPRLQRLVNLEQDPRCVLLVDHYSEDWSRLWWVRISGRAAESPATDDAVAPLARRYPPYREQGAVASVLVLEPDEVTGWANR